MSLMRVLATGMMGQQNILSSARWLGPPGIPVIVRTRPGEQAHNLDHSCLAPFGSKSVNGQKFFSVYY